MEKESGRELFTRMLMIVGGAMALVFSLLTIFNPNLAYVYVSSDAKVYYWPLELLQYYPLYFYSIVPLSFRLFFGLLLASFGGFLGLISGVKYDNKFAPPLSFVGSFLSILGFLPPILSLQPPFTIGVAEVTTGVVRGFGVPWLGICLPLIGVSLMLVSSGVRYNGVQLLTLLGVPFLLVSWLICPFLIVANNVPLLVSVCSSALANNVIGAFAVAGFALTLSGSAMGALKFYAGSKRELFVRLLMVVGGAMALVFGLTAFIPEIAYVLVTRDGSVYYSYDYGMIEYLRLAYNPFFSRFTLGLLVSSIGGFLGLVSAIKRDKLYSLGSVGNFLGILGFLISIPSFQPPLTRSEMFSIRGSMQCLGLEFA